MWGLDDFRCFHLEEHHSVGEGLKPSEESMQSSILFSRIHPCIANEMSDAAAGETTLIEGKCLAKPTALKNPQLLEICSSFHILLLLLAYSIR